MCLILFVIVRMAVKCNWLYELQPINYINKEIIAHIIRVPRASLLLSHSFRYLPLLCGAILLHRSDALIHVSRVAHWSTHSYQCDVIVLFIKLILFNFMWWFDVFLLFIFREAHYIYFRCVAYTGVECSKVGVFVSSLSPIPSAYVDVDSHKRIGNTRAYSRWRLFAAWTHRLKNTIKKSNKFETTQCYRLCQSVLSICRVFTQSLVAKQAFLTFFLRKICGY